MILCSRTVFSNISSIVERSFSFKSSNKTQEVSRRKTASLSKQTHFFPNNHSLFPFPPAKKKTNSAPMQDDMCKHYDYAIITALMLNRCVIIETKQQSSSASSTKEPLRNGALPAAALHASKPQPAQSASL